MSTSQNQYNPPIADVFADTKFECKLVNAINKAKCLGDEGGNC